MKEKSIVIVVALVVLSVIVSCHGDVSHDGPDKIVGIDVSNHNGNIDWGKVVKNNPTISFVYVKASEGATYRDAKYLDNIRGARNAGLRVGAYHYFRMTSSVEDQYENFIMQLESVPFDLIPMVDVETRDNASIELFRSELRQFLDKLE